MFLSLFPQILFLAPFSATLIRVALAILLAYVAWDYLSRADMPSRAAGLVKLTLAAALFAGAWTQLSASSPAAPLRLRLSWPFLSSSLAREFSPSIYPCRFCPPGWNRTNDHLLKREPLYRLSYGRNTQNYSTRALARRALPPFRAFRALRQTPRGGGRFLISHSSPTHSLIRD